jgi:hypothetical protein
MKIRTGFISNSSSQCFILDRRVPEAAKLIENIHAGFPDKWDRCTAMAIGDSVQDFVDSRSQEEYIRDDALNEWLQYWIDELGVENVVFIRESDEGMGGEINNIDEVERLSLSTLEYH